jgi:twinkle protein
MNQQQHRNYSQPCPSQPLHHPRNLQLSSNTLLQRKIGHPLPPQKLQLQQLHQHYQLRTKVFVSSHNDMNITSNQVLDYCATRGINVTHARVSSSHVILQECPFCTKPTNNKADNQYKCYINIGGGAYFCHRCGNGGSWFDFKAQLRGFQHSVTTVSGWDSATDGQYAGTSAGRSSPTIMDNRSVKSATNSTSVAPLPMPKQRLQSFYISSLMDNKKNHDTTDDEASNNNSSSDHALKYLTETRGLTKATLRKYGVGKATYHFPSNEHNGQYVAAECITFPWIMTVKDVKEQEDLRGAAFLKCDDMDSEMEDDDFVTRRIKVRALQQKGWQRMDPAGGGWGLFGFHTVQDATEIVLTEGEYDAMVRIVSELKQCVSRHSHL